MERTTDPLKSDNSMERVHDELFPFFNDIALKSDIFSQLKDIKLDFEARSEGRVPPGYEDRNKKRRRTSSSGNEGPDVGGGSNRFGDLVIWTEIIEHCQRSSANAAIVLTHDAKADWVYQPPKFKDRDGHTKPNNSRGKLNRVYVASPPLVQEIYARAKVDELFVVSVFQLIPVLDRSERAMAVKSLADAVQIEPGPPASSETAQDTVPEVTVPDAADATESIEFVEAVVYDIELQIVDALPVPEEELGVTERALSDRTYISGPNTEIDHIIRDLKSHNRDTQNPAVTRARRALRSAVADPDQIFVLGRNLYQTACGGSREGEIFFRDLPQEFLAFSDLIANLLFAGMLFEAYFGSNGTVRSKPKSEQLQRLLELQSEEQLRRAAPFIGRRLQPYARKFLLIPEVHPEILVANAQFDAVEGGLDWQSVWIDELVLTTTDPPDPFSSPIQWLIRSMPTISGLRSVIANHFRVSKDQISMNHADALRLVVPEELGLDRVGYRHLWQSVLKRCGSCPD